MADPTEDPDADRASLVERKHTPTPLSKLIYRYVTGRVRRGELQQGAAANYWNALGILAKTYGARPPERMSVHDVERWLEARRDLQPASRQLQLSMVRSFCRWLVRERVLRRNPVDELENNPRRPRKEPRALEAESIAALLDVAPDARARAIVWLMVGLGLRCIEVHRLQVEDWSRRDNLLRLTGKGGHTRDVPVTDEAAAALCAYLAEHPATVGPLIRGYRDSRRPLAARYLSQLVSAWLDAAGVKTGPRDGISAHALRHTCASDVLDKSNDLRAVQEMLGHKDLATTSLYLRRASLPAMREAMAGRTYGTAAAAPALHVVGRAEAASSDEVLAGIAELLDQATEAQMIYEDLDHVFKRALQHELVDVGRARDVDHALELLGEYIDVRDGIDPHWQPGDALPIRGGSDF